MKKIFQKTLIEKLICHSVSYNPGIYTFVNPYSYLIARKNIELVKKFDGIYIDGEYLAKLVRLFLKIQIKRISFDMTSVAPDVFSWAERNNKKIALVGTTQANIDKTKAFLLELFPNLNIIYSRNGFFSSKTEREFVLIELTRLAPDLIIAGMGAPLQERFLADIWETGWRGLGFTCGGFFHQSANGLKYYPEWANKLNLRWLYRIYDEPRLLKRYGIYYPLFVFKFISDWIAFISPFKRKKK